MKTFIKASGALVLSAIALNGISGQDPHECVRAKAPVIKNNLVHLQYDSWVKPTGDGDRFHFDRCVLNHQKAKTLFIDWVHTGAKGVTDSQGLVRGGLEAPTKDHEDKKTDLVYGIARTKSPSTYLEVKNVQAGAPTPPPGSLRSYAKMGLLIRGQESDPRFVVDIDVEFESAAMKLGDGTYLYTYSWRDRLAEKRREEEKVFVTWADKFVTQATASKGKSPPSILSSSSQGGYAIDKTPPMFTMETVHFRTTADKGDRSLGTARVSILRPRKSDD